MSVRRTVKRYSLMTARIDATELVKYSKERGTKFYVNFLYILSAVLNSRDDYKWGISGKLRN